MLNVDDYYGEFGFEDTYENMIEYAESYSIPEERIKHLKVVYNAYQNEETFGFENKTLLEKLEETIG